MDLCVIIIYVCGINIQRGKSGDRNYLSEEENKVKESILI